MSVDSIKAYSAVPFKGAEGEAPSSSSPIVPSLLLGGATAAGVGFLTKKPMTEDTFHSTLKDGKDVEFAKDLSAEEKVKYEAAKKAAVEGTPAADAKADAPKVETPLEKAQKAFDEAHLNTQRAEEKLQSSQNMTNKIQNTYDEIAEFDPTAKPLEAGETKKKLEAQKTKLKASIDADEAKLKDDTLGKASKEKIEARIKANKETVKGIDAKIAKPEDITAKYIEELAEKATKEVETAERAATDAKRALETAEIEHTRAKEDLATAKAQPKPDEAKVKELEAKVKSTKTTVETATHTNEIKKAESAFAKEMETALKTTDATARKAALKKIHSAQTAFVDAEGKTGSLVKEVEKFETKRVKSFEKLYSHQTNAPVEAAKDAAYKKAVGKPATAVTETVAKEGGEAAKSIPQAVKDGYEALKGSLKKEKFNGKGAAIWGGVALVATYIIGKAMGGKKPEQA